MTPTPSQGPLHDPFGTLDEGSYERTADSNRALVAQMADVPVPVVEVHSIPLEPVSHSLVGQIFGVSLHQLSVFFRQLATMIDGGLTSARAIDSLSGHVGGHFGTALQAMVRRLNEGAPLYKTLALFPEYFNELMVCLVQAGETGGMLDIRLKELADYLEQAYELRQRLVSQAVYPGIILHFALIVPDLATLVISGMSAYLWTVLPRLAVLYGFCIAIMVANRTASQSSGLRLTMDTAVLYIPMIGRIVRTGVAMRVLRALGDLMEAAVPTSRAIEVAARAGGNSYIALRLLSITRSLNDGMPLSNALSVTGVINPMAMQLLITGEQTGNIGGSLSKAADMLKIDFDNSVKRLANAMPAILMLFVGAVVAYKYISFFQGYFSQINDMFPH